MNRAGVLKVEKNMTNVKIHVKIITIMGNVANKWSQQQLKTSSRSIGCHF